MGRGIPENDIQPRVNIFTYPAWKALGRTVKRGEHGVKVVAWIVCQKKDDQGVVVSTFKRPKSATVFHISQTRELGQ